EVGRAGAGKKPGVAGTAYGAREIGVNGTGVKTSAAAAAVRAQQPEVGRNAAGVKRAAGVRAGVLEVGRGGVAVKIAAGQQATERDQARPGATLRTIAGARAQQREVATNGLGYKRDAE